MGIELIGQVNLQSSSDLPLYLVSGKHQIYRLDGCDFLTALRHNPSFHWPVLTPNFLTKNFDLTILDITRQKHDFFFFRYTYGVSKKYQRQLSFEDRNTIAPYPLYRVLFYGCPSLYNFGSRRCSRYVADPVFETSANSHAAKIV